VTIDPALERLSQDPQRVAMASAVIAPVLHCISAADARSR
jgi:hypothetical protein